jgi:hypothetical protein
VWSGDVQGSYPVIETALRPAATGHWQAPVALSISSVPTGDHNSTAPDIAFDRQGNAIAVWTHEEIGPTVIQAAVRRAARGVWEPAVDISRPDRSLTLAQFASQAHVAIDGLGNAVAIWKMRINGVNYIIQTASRPAGSDAWRVPIDHTSPDVTAEQPQIAMDAFGNALGIWLHAGPPGSRYYRAVQAGIYAVTPRGHAVPAAPAVPTAATAGQSVASPPRITAARLTRTRFRAATGRSNRSRVGATFVVQLSAAARLRTVFSQARPGLRRGEACVAPRPSLSKLRAARCTRSVARGSRVLWHARQGVTAFAFDGRAGGSALVPGTYTATLLAANTGGHSAPKTLRFTIIA